jgi:hypothetical protein
LSSFSERMATVGFCEKPKDGLNNSFARHLAA